MIGRHLPYNQSHLKDFSKIQFYSRVGGEKREQVAGIKRMKGGDFERRDAQLFDGPLDELALPKLHENHDGQRPLPVSHRLLRV